MMNADSYDDLTALFTECDEAREEDDFTKTVMSSVQANEKTRRFILSTFGLIGGLIAGSQIPSLINLGQEFFGDLVPVNGLPILDVTQPSLLLCLVAAFFGLFVFWLSALEAA